MGMLLETSLATVQLAGKRLETRHLLISIHYVNGQFQNFWINSYRLVSGFFVVIYLQNALILLGRKVCWHNDPMLNSVYLIRFKISQRRY